MLHQDAMEYGKMKKFKATNLRQTFIFTFIWGVE